MHVIEIKNLTKNYKAKDFWNRRDTVGVENINLNVAQGEVFGLLGLNGAGKTTLMKIILGLLKPASGTANILGGTIESPEIRGMIGYLPELNYYPKYLKAYEFLEFFSDLLLTSHGKKTERIQEVLGLVRFPGRRDIRLGDCSKGMLGRLGMAQALLNDPEILFLDEPMTGLDPLGYKETRNIILELKRRGKTIFFNSHILTEVERLCDRVGIIHEGRLKEVKTLTAIKEMNNNLEDYFISVVAPGNK